MIKHDCLLNPLIVVDCLIKNCATTFEIDVSGQWANFGLCSFLKKFSLRHKTWPICLIGWPIFPAMGMGAGAGPP